MSAAGSPPGGVVRGSFIGLLAFLVVLASPASAIGQPDADAKVESAAGRGLEAMWWEKDGRLVHYYSLYVVEIPPDAENPLLRHRARLDILQCKARYHECAYGQEVHRRVEVISFEMDPLVMSARAVLELDGRRGEMTWTATEEPGDPVGSDNNESAGFDRTYVRGSAWASRSREATAEGRLFGIDLSPGEVDWAYMRQSGYASVWACAARERTCDDPIERRRVGASGGARRESTARSSSG